MKKIQSGDPMLIDVASLASGVGNKSSQTIRIGVRNPDQAFEITTQFNDTKNNKGKLYLAPLGRHALGAIYRSLDREVFNTDAKISVKPSELKICSNTPQLNAQSRSFSH